MPFDHKRLQRSCGGQEIARLYGLLLRQIAVEGCVASVIGLVQRTVYPRDRLVVKASGLLDGNGGGRIVIVCPDLKHVSMPE